jgi:UDP-N-acetyl-2-amino-2-deoxyglucuronate dehydrogenase
MAQKSRKVCLIGCGRIANKRHAPLLKSGGVKGAYLGGVCDIDTEKGFLLSHHYEVPYYNNFHTMMRYENPDIVSILTPSGMHGRHIKQLLEYGKPLIVEKPLTLVYAEAEQVTELAKQAGVPLFVVKQNRFNPPVVHLKRAMDDGRLGDIVVATVTVRWCRHPEYYKDWHGTWEMAGGVLANQAIHHIDLLTWLLGQPSSVFAHYSKQDGIEVEDTLVGILRYPSGALASLELTAATRPKDLEGSITVLGTEGVVKVGGFAVNEMSLWEFDTPEPEDAEIRKTIESPPNIYGYGHKAFYEHVLDCLNNNTETPIDGRTSLRVVTALYQSVETGKEVLLSEDPISKRLGVRE